MKLFFIRRRVKRRNNFLWFLRFFGRKQQHGQSIPPGPISLKETRLNSSFILCVCLISDPSRTRTYDLQIRSQLLYPTELWSHAENHFFIFWTISLISSRVYLSSVYRLTKIIGETPSLVNTDKFFHFM